MTGAESSLRKQLLRYIHAEEFCALGELEECVRLWGGEAAATSAWIAEWQARGWLEEVSQGEPELSPLLHLTDQAYTELPWLVQAT